MAVDGSGTEAHDAAMLGAAIAEEMAVRKMKNVGLARHFDVDGSTVSRWLSGQIHLTIRQVVAIERFLEVTPRGALFVRAGLVELPSTLEETISTDPRLNSRGRQLVQDALHIALWQTAEPREGP